MTVFVVGLDGADWSLLRPWIADGSLPAFERIREEGVHGPLESSIPPITFPAWKCYSTGKSPGRLGVYEWFRFDRDGPSIDANDSQSFRSLEYWDVLRAAGIDTAVINMPTTHPPTPKAGDDLLEERYGTAPEELGDRYVIAGSPASERGEFTFPADLKADLLGAVPDYRVKPDLVLDEADPRELIEEGKQLVSFRFEAAEWFARERDVDVVHTTVFVTDTAQHRLWDHPTRLRDLYEHIDAFLQNLLERPFTDAVFLMSDHGFTGIEEWFLPNQWLRERGDLVVESQTSRKTLASVGLTRERLKAAVGRLGLVNLAQALVPESLQRWFPSETGRVAIQDAAIDWSETKAISLGRGPVYVNEEAFESGADRAAFVSSLAEALESLATPDGDPAVSTVHDPADIYAEVNAPAPDIVVEYETGIDSPEAIGGEVFGERTEWLATHAPEGIFAATGTDIGKGEYRLGIQDLAPTILHYLDVPVPGDVDGSVQQAILAGNRAGAPVEEGPPTAVGAGSGGVDEAVEESLRNLGYME